MPWFAIDDGFTTHPKVRKAGNAAAGLFCRLGAHCSKHLTDGLVDGVMARELGTAAQLRKLITVGLLHDDSHRCDRCPQPEPGGYVLHDYLDYNRSRKQIDAARDAGRKRQQKGRERQSENRADNQTGAQPNLNRGSTEAQPNLGWGSVDPQNEVRFEDSTAGQDGSSRRDTLQGPTVVPAPPIPSSSTSYGSTAAAGEHASGDHGFAELRSRIAGVGLSAVEWRLSTAQLAKTNVALKRVGVDAMVAFAENSARLRGIPAGASAWVDGWYSLEPAPPPSTELAPRGSRDVVVPFPPAGARPSTTDRRVQDVYDATAELKRELGMT
jgi:hypothetical protein